MHVCMYVRTYVCIYVCMYYLCIYVCVCMYVFMYVGIYICVCKNMYVLYMYILLQNIRTIPKPGSIKFLCNVFWFSPDFCNDREYQLSSGMSSPRCYVFRQYVVYTIMWSYNVRMSYFLIIYGLSVNVWLVCQCMDCLSLYNTHLKWKLIQTKNIPSRTYPKLRSSIMSYMIISIHVSRLITINTDPWNNVLNSSISQALQSVSFHEHSQRSITKCWQRLKLAKGDWFTGNST
jgi:hypothetical protein